MREVNRLVSYKSLVVFAKVKVEPKEVKEEVKEVKEEVKKNEKDPKKVRSKQKVNAEQKVEPKWEDLYLLLSQASICFLRSVVRRDDIPDDVKHILHGVISLGDVSDYCILEQHHLTTEKALFWADELKAWAEKRGKL